MRHLAWIILFLPLTASPSWAGSFCFQMAGEIYQVSPTLLLAIARAESNPDPAATNHNRNGTVDVGLMQNNSIWRDQLGPTWDYLFNPCTNIMTGAWILSRCFQDYGYTWQAVGCYHSRTPTRRDAYAARIASIIREETR